jgi:hypothetical protein
MSSAHNGTTELTRHADVKAAVTSLRMDFPFGHFRRGMPTLSYNQHAKAIFAPPRHNKPRGEHRSLQGARK